MEVEFPLRQHTRREEKETFKNPVILRMASQDANEGPLSLPSFSLKNCTGKNMTAYFYDV
jgi:hypothetical protein